MSVKTRFRRMPTLPGRLEGAACSAFGSDGLLG